MSLTPFKKLRARLARPPRLSRLEIRAVQALAKTVFPAHPEMSLAGDDARVVAYLEDMLAELPLRERVLLRSLFLAFDAQSLLLRPLSFSRFSSLTPAARKEELERWDRSPYYFARLVFQAMRGVLLWAYVDNPEVGQAMGIEDGAKIIARAQSRDAEPAEVLSKEV